MDHYNLQNWISANSKSVEKGSVSMPQQPKDQAEDPAKSNIPRSASDNRLSEETREASVASSSTVIATSNLKHPDSLNKTQLLHSSKSANRESVVAKNSVVTKNSVFSKDSEVSENNIVSFFSDSKNTVVEPNKIIQVYPETSGIKMLYANSEKKEHYVAVPVLCWALKACGDIVGLVPWINEVLSCDEIAARFDLCWEGYYDESNEEILAFPPGYAVAMLTTAARFRREKISGIAKSHKNIVEEFSDQIGSHVLLLNAASQSLNLEAVICWQLDNEGVLHSMLADESRAEKYPVVAGDSCLYRAHENQHFRCFFQRDIANQIRDRDPETLRAIEELFILED